MSSSASSSSSQSFSTPATTFSSPIPSPLRDDDDIVELLAPESERERLATEAASLPRIVLTEETDLQWLHVLSEGWASPLRGYMREDEYLQCLHFNCIRFAANDGEMTSVAQQQQQQQVYNQSVPIVLAVTDEQRKHVERESGGERGNGAADGAATGPAFALTTADAPDTPVAIVRDAEFYAHNKEERCARQFGTVDARHPYAEIVYRSGDWLVGGDVEVLRPITYGDGLDAYRLSPRQLRDEFRRRGADAVFVFQLRNPVHNGHALLMNSCRDELKRRGYRNPLLLVHQIGGKVKGDDVPLDTRMAQNREVLAEGILDPDTTLLGIFPSPMLYGGPTEVQWHAKARMNAGCQFYIVGRDPAGVKHPAQADTDLFDPWHGKRVLALAPGLERLEILPFRVAAYDTTAGAMAFFDPARADDFMFISGTKMRGYAARGEMPPKGFMGERAWQVLTDFYREKMRREQEAGAHE